MGYVQFSREVLMAFYETFAQERAAKALANVGLLKTPWFITVKFSKMNTGIYGDIIFESF